MDNLKNLIELSSNFNISVYNKRNKLRPQNTLMKEIEKIKKKELKKTSSLLSNLAKLTQKGGTINNIDEVDTTVILLKDNISKIDEFIKILPSVYETKKDNCDYDSYIECYTNDD